MKIGIDARFYHPRHSGNSRYQRELIKNLLKIDRKNQYVIFVNKEGAEAFKDDFSQKPENVKLVIFNYPHYSLAEQTKFIKVIEAQNLDLIHFAHINHPIFYREPFVVTMPDLTLYYFPGKEKLNFIKRWAYNLVMLSAIHHSQKIIAVSKNTKKELIEKLNAPERKIKVIYEGVDQQFRIGRNLSRLKKILRKYRITKPYLIYLGQWRMHKNLPRLIEGFAKAIKAGLKSQLVIVGKTDNRIFDLKKMINELGLKKEIILTGFVPDKELPLLYRGATAYAFPSLSEGFGLPPLEAMANGIPVISSNASCMPEILGKAALYFDPYDIDDISRAIKKIMTDKKLGDGLRIRGLKRVKKYSWEKMARETLLIYNQIIK